MKNIKPWYLSKTILGIIIAGVGLISKTFFNTFIPDVSSEIVEVVGLVIALIGRVKAENFIG